MRNLVTILFMFASLVSTHSLMAAESIRVASTSPTQHSGLLDYLYPIFTAKSGVEVKSSIGTIAEAINLGKEGKVDAILVHAEDVEKQLVEEGFFLDREDVMYNQFVILGPKNDPAGVSGTQKATEAFQKIRSSSSLFASRSDNSETNMRENLLWASTGKMPSRGDKWYLSTGMGEENSIRLAAEKQAYTIARRTTWLTMEDKDKLDLHIVLQGDPALFDQYGVLITNPAKHKDIDYRLAMNFEIWITSPEGQKAIAAFKDKNGNFLFTPNAK